MNKNNKIKSLFKNLICIFSLIIFILPFMPSIKVNADDDAPYFKMYVWCSSDITLSDSDTFTISYQKKSGDSLSDTVYTYDIVANQIADKNASEPTKIEVAESGYYVITKLEYTGDNEVIANAYMAITPKIKAYSDAEVEENESLGRTTVKLAIGEEQYNELASEYNGSSTLKIDDTHTDGTGNETVFYDIDGNAYTYSPEEGVQYIDEDGSVISSTTETTTETENENTEVIMEEYEEDSLYSDEYGVESQTGISDEEPEVVYYTEEDTEETTEDTNTSTGINFKKYLMQLIACGILFLVVIGTYFFIKRKQKNE